MMWSWGNGSWDWGAWLPMMLFMLALLVVIGWAVVMFTRYWTSRPPYHGSVEHANDPQRILDERFARGEIDEEEYRNRKAVLQVYE